METFSALLAICAGNSPVIGEFPTQRPVTQSFVFFDLRLNKRLSKQWWGWWFETPSRPLWCFYNGSTYVTVLYICLRHAICFTASWTCYKESQIINICSCAEIWVIHLYGINAPHVQPYAMIPLTVFTWKAPLSASVPSWHSTACDQQTPTSRKMPSSDGSRTKPLSRRGGRLGTGRGSLSCKGWRVQHWHGALSTVLHPNTPHINNLSQIPGAKVSPEPSYHHGTVHTPASILHAQCASHLHSLRISNDVYTPSSQWRRFMNERNK